MWAEVGQGETGVGNAAEEEPPPPNPSTAPVSDVGFQSRTSVNASFLPLLKKICNAVVFFVRAATRLHVFFFKHLLRLLPRSLSWANKINHSPRVMFSGLVEARLY